MSINFHHTEGLVPPKITRPFNTLSNELGLVEIEGNLEKCGQVYGQIFANLIYGFLSQETNPNADRIKLAEECLPFIEKHTPLSLQFLKGLAKGSQLTLEQLVVLSLHEEIYHEKNQEDGHCTAFLVSASNSSDSKTLVAQNWDWQPAHYLWASLLKIKSDQAPHTLTYNYPGLWAGCGLNSEGLAHMWTGSGYYPTLVATPGVPSYLLISELLSKNSVAEAVDFLSATPNAGAYIFLLADKSGHVAVVEALPGSQIKVDYNPATFRSNQYENPELILASNQSIDPNHSIALRRDSAEAFMDEKPNPSLASLQRLLTTSPIYRGLGEEKFQRSTEDSLIADCKECVLWTRRGGLFPGEWIATKL